MDTFTPQFSFTVIYGALSFAVYILTVVIIQSDKTTFSGSFFFLFKANFFYNLLTFSNSFVSLRVPQNTCYNCSLAPFFHSLGNDSTSSFPLHIFYGIQLTMVFPQYSMNLLISLNRFTMFFWLNRNDKNWKLICPFALILITFLPFVETYGMFLDRSYFVYGPTVGGFICFSRFEIQGILSTAIGFMTLSTALSAFLNISSLVFLSKMGEKIKKVDRTLLYVSLISFFVELFCLVETLLVKFHKEIPLWLAAAAIWIIPYSSDLLTMSQPWVLIMFSSAMQEKLKRLFGCGDSPKPRIVSVSSRQSALSVTAAAPSF